METRHSPFRPGDGSLNATNVVVVLVVVRFSTDRYETFQFTHRPINDNIMQSASGHRAGIGEGAQSALGGKTFLPEI